MRNSNVIILGCGGVGGRVASHILPFCKSLRLLDGDIFEEKNADRQLGVKPGKPKVDALKDFLQAHNGGYCPPIETCLGFIGTPTADDVLDDWLLNDSSIVIMTVDNYAARRRILKKFYDKESWPAANLLLAGGNEYWDGHALAQLPHWDGTPSGYTTMYPETLTEEDPYDPAEPDCTELAHESEPQLASTNAAVAMLITQLLVFYEVTLDEELLNAAKNGSQLLPLEHWLAGGNFSTRRTNLAGDPAI
jgi:hypothetical protein